MVYCRERQFYGTSAGKKVLGDEVDIKKYKLTLPCFFELVVPKCGTSRYSRLLTQSKQVA